MLFVVVSCSVCVCCFVASLMLAVCSLMCVVRCLHCVLMVCCSSFVASFWVGVDVCLGIRYLFLGFRYCVLLLLLFVVCCC